MIKRLMRAAVLLVVLLAAAQFVRPDRANPPTDPSHAIQAQPGVSSTLTAVLDRSCSDCHSNHTMWPWYTQIAPLSWLMAASVGKGRAALNFSEWTTYTPEERRTLLEASCADATGRTMPGPYTLVRPETELSAADIEVICSAAHQTTNTAGQGGVP